MIFKNLKIFDIKKKNQKKKIYAQEISRVLLLFKSALPDGNDLYLNSIKTTNATFFSSKKVIFYIFTKKM